MEVSLSKLRMDNESYTIGFINDISIRKGFETEVQRQQMQLAETNKRIEQMNDELEEKVELRTKQLKETLGRTGGIERRTDQGWSKEKELSLEPAGSFLMASRIPHPLSTILSSASPRGQVHPTDEQERRIHPAHQIVGEQPYQPANEFSRSARSKTAKIIANNIRFNIREMITALCTELEGIARKISRSTTATKARKPSCFDPTSLRNVITNLVSNAIKFSAEDGTIDVSE